MTATITQPGVYDMPEAEYHAHPALSSTGARKLLPPSCPALFKYEQEHPPAPKAVFDIGHAAHRLALGVGPEIVELPYDSMRSNAAKDFDADARAHGKIPLKVDDFAMVTAMGRALLAHPLAAKLFEPGPGKPEASLFWDDPIGVQRRARLDWLRDSGRERLIIPDYKSARSADPDQFVKSAADYGYHQQGAWYLDAATALELDDKPMFVFVVQEKTAPYLVSVIELDEYALRIGRHLNHRAIRTFSECTSSGVWPGYVSNTDVALTSLPFWYERKFEDELS